MTAFTTFDSNLFYTTANNGTKLGSFTSTGSYAEIGSFELSDGTAVSPAYGFAFGPDGQAYVNKQDSLYKIIDITSDQKVIVDPIGTFSGGVQTHSLDVAPDQKMVALGLNGILYEINLSDATTTAIATTRVGGVGGNTISQTMDIVFDQNGDLFAVDGAGKIYFVDVGNLDTTGSTTYADATLLGTKSGAMGLAASNSGKLYASNFGSNEWYEISISGAPPTSLNIDNTVSSGATNPHGGDQWISYSGWNLGTTNSTTSTSSSGGGDAAPVTIAPPVDTTPTDPAPVDTTPTDPAPAGTNTQPTDSDNDGLREVVTANDGTTVDGNRDGIADAEQTEVAGLRLINDGAQGSDYGAISIGNGLQLDAVTLTSASSDNTFAVTTRGGGTLAVTTPTGISNAFAGVVSFNVSGVEPGGSTTATITFPTGLPANGDAVYLRFNYNTNQFEEYVDAQGNPLYSFVDQNGDGTPDAVVLQLTDGDPQWDGDGVANGTIVDPGFLGNGQRSFIGTKKGDEIIGNILANEIEGNAGNDWLHGDQGDDILRGGKGKDRLHGGAGADLIIGGKKWRDYIVYLNSQESTIDRPDTVKFHRNDRFDFRSFDGDSANDGRQSLKYIGDGNFSGSAGELRKTSTGLEADTTGDMTADFVVNFFGKTNFFSSEHILL